MSNRSATRPARLWMILLAAVVAAGAFAPGPASADGEKAKPKREAGTDLGSLARTSHDMDEQVVEGMSRKALDSLQHVGKRDRRRMPRLYRKRTNFRDEISAAAREASYQP